MIKLLYRLFYWLDDTRIVLFSSSNCTHDWECCNTECMLTVSAETVRFKCRKCGKVEGLHK